MPTAFATESVVEPQESKRPNVQVSLKSPFDAAEIASDLRQCQQESNASFLQPLKSNVGRETEDLIDDPNAPETLNNTNGASSTQEKMPPEAVRSSTRTRKRPFIGDMIYSDAWSTTKYQDATARGSNK